MPKEFFILGALGKLQSPRVWGQRRQNVAILSLWQGPKHVCKWKVFGVGLAYPFVSVLVCFGPKDFLASSPNQEVGGQHAIWGVGPKSPSGLEAKKKKTRK